jgi:ATP-dependent Lhr-like helicase
VIPGPRLPRTAGARVLWRDGEPVATVLAGEVDWLVPPGPLDRRAAEDALRRVNPYAGAFLDACAASQPSMEATHTPS